MDKSKTMHLSIVESCQERGTILIVDLSTTPERSPKYIMAQKLTIKERVIQTVTPVVLPLMKLYWFVFRPHTEGVKVVLRNENGQLLLVRHAYGSGDWTFPGGGTETKETPKQTARREMREELAVNVSELQEHESFVSTKEYKHDHITICSGVVTDKVEPSPFEIAEAQWFKKDNLPELDKIAQKIYDTYKQDKMKTAQVN